MLERPLARLKAKDLVEFTFTADPWMVIHGSSDSKRRNDITGQSLNFHPKQRFTWMARTSQPHWLTIRSCFHKRQTPEEYRYLTQQCDTKI